MKRILFFVALMALCCVTVAGHPDSVKKRVLIFAKTIRPAHAKIILIAGPALAARLTNEGFEASFTQDTNLLNTTNLGHYDTLVLLDVTESILNSDQQTAVEAFFNHGGGIVAIHGSISAGKDWPWFKNLLGTTFVDHAPMQLGTVRLFAPNDFANQSLPVAWSQTDEWYNFSSQVGFPAKVLQVADLQGSKVGDFHPITWSQERGLGRFWYTALGHSASLYTDQSAIFSTMLSQAVRWTTGVAHHQQSR